MDFIEDLAPINYYKLRSYLEIIPPCLPRKSIIPPNFIIPPRELCNYLAVFFFHMGVYFPV